MALDDASSSISDSQEDLQHAAPTPAEAPEPAPVEQGPKMISRATQAGGVDQGTQVDFPCQRCVYSQYSSIGHYSNYHYSHDQQQQERYHHHTLYSYPPSQPAAPQWHHGHQIHNATYPGQAVFPVQNVDQGRGPRLAPAPMPPPPLVSLPPAPLVPTPNQPVAPPVTPAPPHIPPGQTAWDTIVLRRTWSNIEDAEEDIKNLAESLGFALIRRRSGNRDPDSGKPTRIHYCCHLDAARITHLDRNPENRKRKRESAVGTTKKHDPCPWQICLRWNRQKRDRPDLYHMWHLAWTMGDDVRFRTHNHPMDPDAANIPANRRRHMTQEVKDQILEFVARGMSAAEVVEAMKEKNPRLKLNKSAIDNVKRADMLDKKKAEDGAAGGSGENAEKEDGGDGGDGGQNDEAGSSDPTAEGQAPAPTASLGTETTGAKATTAVAMTGLAQNTPPRLPRAKR